MNANYINLTKEEFIEYITKLNYNILASMNLFEIKNIATNAKKCKKMAAYELLFMCFSEDYSK